MPSKDMNDVLAVEELVHEIKENLRLKARPSHNHGRNSRPSPYHVPCRSWNDQQTPSQQTQQHQLNQQTTCSSSSNNTNSSSNNNNNNMIGCGSTNNNLNNLNCINNTNNTVIHNHNNYNNSNSNCNCNCKNHHHNNKKSSNNVDDIDDPYELLQALLKKQNLVKEAVRRLQLNISPKQRYFYESDDDGSRSPLYYNRVYQLEL